MFEQRILCHALPNSFHATLNESDEKPCTKKSRDKTLQDLKRQMLQKKLEQYELRIHQCTILYEQTLTRFYLETGDTSSWRQMKSSSEFMHYVTCYLHHHAKLCLRQIRYTESSFHVKLLRQQHCHRPSSRMNKHVDVYPRIIVDVPHVALNSHQLDYLSRAGEFDHHRANIHVHSCFFSLIHLGPNYIRPNQSYLYSSERREREARQQYSTIMKTVITHLIRVHRMPLTSTVIQQFSQRLLGYLRARYMAPVSYLDAHRTRKELKLIKQIQFRLKKHNYILRVTDKSGIFHLGHAADYERKAEAYRQRTAAYIELDSDPLWAVFDKVVRLLNDLRAKNYIRVWQLNQMMPDRKKIALAYLYFIPKPHKVTQI